MPQNQNEILITDKDNPFLVAVATAEEQTLGELYPSAHGEDRSNNAPAKGVCRNCDYPIEESSISCRYCDGVST